jgi:hypothetical protein
MPTVITDKAARKVIRPGSRPRVTIRYKPAEAVISPSTSAAQNRKVCDLPPWAGVTFDLAELPDFRARWGLRLVALDWTGRGPAVGTFAPAGV